MAYISFNLVQGLCLHTIGWESRFKGETTDQYYGYIHSKWFLAWSKLDLYCLGVLEWPVFDATNGAEKSGETKLHCCSWAAVDQSLGSSSGNGHLCADIDRLGVLPLGKCWLSCPLLLQSVPGALLHTRGPCCLHLGHRVRGGSLGSGVVPAGASTRP